MAGPTKKTTPAKKAAPAAQKEPAISRFNSYRERAANLKIGVARTVEPYVVSASELDDNLDADVVLIAPAKLSDQLALDQAVRGKDFVAIISIMGGQIALDRLVGAFERLEEESGEDAGRLFAALCYDVVNHLNGPGAAEVPTPAS
ncbi:hypothetical protein FK268_09165 [Tsukamurella sputi]|uniref:Uncharacterized protein n=1 Tax=Tsukamurella sputi TaxID=2591848 RepID=A0A5C5RST7_9ACTN|nr:hypothetical protein [Tsukamurella sputi]TWS25351.1 hypothetical protein FK268_09165 [Tsukamurella sputi]